VLLHDLHALACNGEFPVLHSRIGDEFAQRPRAVFWRLENLADQVARERDILERRRRHGDEIVRLDREREIEKRAVLQVLRGEAGVGPKSRPFLPSIMRVSRCAPTSAARRRTPCRRPWPGGARSAPD